MKMAVLVFLALAGSLFAQETPGPVTGVAVYFHAVNNLDQTVAFYREAFGLETLTPVPAKPVVNEYIQKVTGTVGGLFRLVRLKLPGAEFALSLTEFTGLDRQPGEAAPWDPGAATLILRVRDKESAARNLRKVGARFVSLPGADSLLVRDPDGFFVEVTEAPSSPDSASLVVSAAIGITVGDTAAAVRFFNGLLGFRFRLDESFSSDRMLLAAMGASSGSMKVTKAFIPGTDTEVRLYEFQGINRSPFHLHSADPGAAVLGLNTGDVNALLVQLKTAGVKVLSTGGVPANNAVFVENADGFKVELLQRH